MSRLGVLAGAGGVAVLGTLGVVARRVLTEDEDHYERTLVRISGIPIASLPYTTQMITGGVFREGAIEQLTVRPQQWPVSERRAWRLKRDLGLLRHGPLKRVIPAVGRHPSSTMVTDIAVHQSQTAPAVESYF